MRYCSRLEDYPLKPLPPQGLFISSTTLKQPKTASDTWHHHPSQPPNLRRFSRRKQSQIFQADAKPSSFLSSTDTFLSPTHLPHTSLLIAFTDAVGVPLAGNQSAQVLHLLRGGRRRIGGGLGERGGYASGSVRLC